MFKTVLWAIYLLSVLGMITIDSAMLYQARKKIKESGLEPVKSSRQMKVVSKFITMIYDITPVWNTLMLFYMFFHFEELVESAVKKVLDKG